MQNWWSIQLWVQTSGFSLFCFSLCILTLVWFWCRESRMGPCFLKYKRCARHSFPLWPVLNGWILSFSFYDSQGLRPKTDFKVFLGNSGSEMTVSIIQFTSFGFALTFGSCWLKILKGEIHSILFSHRKIIKVSYSGRAYIKLLPSAFQDIRRSLFLQSLGPEWRCAISLKGPIENSPDVICNRLWRDSSKVWRIWVPLSHPAG